MSVSIGVVHAHRLELGRTRNQAPSSEATSTAHLVGYAMACDESPVGSVSVGDGHSAQATAALNALSPDPFPSLLP